MVNLQGGWIQVHLGPGHLDQQGLVELLSGSGILSGHLRYLGDLLLWPGEWVYFCLGLGSCLDIEDILGICCCGLVNEFTSAWVWALVWTSKISWGSAAVAWWMSSLLPGSGLLSGHLRYLGDLLLWPGEWVHFCLGLGSCLDIEDILGICCCGLVNEFTSAWVWALVWTSKISWGSAAVAWWMSSLLSGSGLLSGHRRYLGDLLLWPGEWVHFCLGLGSCLDI